MRTIYLLTGLLLCKICFSQDVAASLTQAMTELSSDPQFKHSLISMYVTEDKTGKVIYNNNGNIGMVPASCQKIITSAAAFEMLGKNYQYKTLFKIKFSADTSWLFIEGSGDPSLGSWRWKGTSPDSIFKAIGAALIKKQVKNVYACIERNKFSYQPLPDGWVWQDIGNYYGAGAWQLNWHENQYDLFLSPGESEGELSRVKRFEPAAAELPLANYIKTGKRGSGDNAYLYAAPYSHAAFATGTIPAGQEEFKISGAISNPPDVFFKQLKSSLKLKGIFLYELKNSDREILKESSLVTTIATLVSPTFDSLNFWFMKKSINLYGEAFVKTISLEKTGIASTDSGVAQIKNFWVDKGIERSAINIIDGSGLSPANRITAKTLVQVLQYAAQQKWFASFYNALPEMNGIKMKDGYIGGVRAYTGYVKSAAGVGYSFAFMVNNFDGNASSAREKMWRVLNLLK